EAITALGVRPVELRYYLSAPHYRSTVDFSEAALHEAATAYQRLENFVAHAVERVGAVEPGVFCADFVEAMDDDLNTSRAVAAIHETVRAGTSALAEGKDVSGPLASVRAMLGVLGLDPLDPHWAGTGDGNLKSTVDGLVALALQQREAARQRKDW